MFSKIKFLLTTLFSFMLFSNINSCRNCGNYQPYCDNSQKEKQVYITNSHVPDYEMSPERLREIIKIMGDMKIKNATSNNDPKSGSTNNSSEVSPVGTPPSRD